MLRTGRLVAGTQDLTNAEANCSIAGTGGGATMQCRPSTAKTLYNYNTALVVEANGVAYVIACRVPLILVLCKKLDTGSVVEGRMDKALLAITDGNKVRRYQILTSANVGPLPLSQPPPPRARRRFAPSRLQRRNPPCHPRIARSTRQESREQSFPTIHQRLARPRRVLASSLHRSPRERKSTWMESSWATRLP